MIKTTIEPALLAEPVEGVNLLGPTLGDNLSGQPTLMVFLRHFGCIFCREMVADIREVAEADPAYPRVLFFYMAEPNEGEPFFAKHWPGAHAIADKPKRFYTAFDVGRGGVVEMFGPESWLCGAKAAMKGHTIGGTKGGDAWTLPTLLLVEGGRHITWAYHGKNASDHPDFARIAGRVTARGTA